MGRLHENLFKGFNFLKKADLSDSNVTTICDSAFKDCSSLDEISFPKTLTDIQDFAFYFCNELMDVDLSNTQITRIRDFSFQEFDILPRLKPWDSF